MFQEPIIAKVGETVRAELPYSGFPVPEAKWSKDGKPLIAIGTVRLETMEHFVILTVRNVNREDGGHYSVTIKNQAGSDTATIEVRVVDQPSPPQGPLEMSNVTMSSVTLSWRPPKDDGGSRIVNYIIEKKGDLDMRWKPVTDDNITNLTYEVKGLKVSKEYVFRIKAQNQFGISEPLEGHEITSIEQFGEFGILFVVEYLQVCGKPEWYW